MSIEEEIWCEEHITGNKIMQSGQNIRKQNYLKSLVSTQGPTEAWR